MTPGRCAGCGEISASCKKIKAHIVTCPEYLRLFKEDRARALEPAEEYERWQLEENNEERRLAARAARAEGYRQEADLKLARQRRRWAKQ